MNIYQIDAFTDRLFSGNPAAVIPLTAWLPDDIMQSIAMENNLAETAFIVPYGEDYHIRWFTPSVEVDLCGHATLASAFVFYEELGYMRQAIRFFSQSGWLTVTKSGEGYSLDFPASPAVQVDITPEMRACCSGEILEAWRASRDFMFVLKDAHTLTSSLFPIQAMEALGHTGLIFTAPGDDVDFVSRFFAPAFGIPEDPVTGSSHTVLTPYWAKRFGMVQLTARQLSARGGWLKLELHGDRVYISGQAVLYLKGDIKF